MHFFLSIGELACSWVHNECLMLVQEKFVTKPENKYTLLTMLKCLMLLTNLPAKTYLRRNFTLPIPTFVSLCFVHAGAECLAI